MVRVSKVEQVRGRRVRIILDDDTAYLLLRSAYQERQLLEGDLVDPAVFSQWVLTRQYRSALDKAVSMLAVRACSKGEISQKLRRIGYAQETIEMVLYKLEKEGFLDDSAFAAQWTSYRADQKYGPRRIAQELRFKGVGTEETESAISEISEDQQLDSAVLLARKALRRCDADEDARKKRQKITGAIVRRGFSWDLARQACDRVLGESDED